MGSISHGFNTSTQSKLPALGKLGCSVVYPCAAALQRKGKDIHSPESDKNICKKAFWIQFSLPPNSKQIFSATPLILVCGFWRWLLNWLDKVTQCKTDLHDLNLLLTSTPHYGFIGNASTECPQDSARGTAVLVPLQWGMEFWLFGHVRRLGQARDGPSFLFCDNRPEVCSVCSACSRRI